MLESNWSLFAYVREMLRLFGKRKLAPIAANDAGAGAPNERHSRHVNADERRWLNSLLLGGQIQVASSKENPWTFTAIHAPEDAQKNCE